MKKPLVIIGVVVALLAIGGVLYASRQKEPVATVTTTAEQPAKTQESESTATTPGSYVAYSSEAVTKATGTKVIFFHASWCPQCRQLDASIKAGKVPDNTTFFKADYDSNQALRKKYGVTIQTTLVTVDDTGKLVRKYVAYDDPTLQSVINNLL